MVDASNIALQMYTVRDAASADVQTTLEKIRRIGYQHIELAGQYDKSVSDWRRMLANNGLTAPSAHVALPLLETELNSTLDFYTDLGVKYIVCPWIGPELRGGVDAYASLAAKLDVIGKQCLDRGLKFCYHNHDFEFELFGDVSGFDTIFANCDPSHVKIELDTYWVEYAGLSNLDLISKYTRRIPLVHLKDMAFDPSRTFAEIGSGSMDFRTLIPKFDANGAEWLIVEQDKCAGDPFQSIETSLINLQSLLKEM